MAPAYQFAVSLRFWPAIAQELVASIPAAPGVFALGGERETDQPYLSRAADLRRRIARLLAPPELSANGIVQTRRLNLRDRVHSIAYTATGSEFESLLLLADATASLFGAEQARRRLRLRAPYCLRLTTENAFPRLYVTNRLSARGLERMWGPFASRNAAERQADGILDLFKLRRCYEELDPAPDHPGCIYGEMKRCMAPCNLTASPEQYLAEAAAVEAFLRTRGQSMLATVAAEREQASEQMDFERAAALHERYTRVESIANGAGELVGPIPALRAVIVQPAVASPQAQDRQEASLFLVAGGCIVGPEPLSTLGVRAVKEQTSVGSSLFAQPLMLEAVPLDGTALETPETRAAAAIERLARRAQPGPHAQDLASLGDHLALLRRWYYRPEKSRTGEIFFPNPDGSWPVRRILRGAARAALGDPGTMAETRREDATAAKVKILHEGRAGVERVVPVLARRGRRRSQPELATVLDTNTVIDPSG